MKSSIMKYAGIATVLAAIASPALAEGDPEAGKKVYNKCKACHALEEGKNRVGPSLYQIIGRSAGSIEGFKYSKAMQESGLTWDEKTLAEFLARPKELVPGTRMAFPGLRKDEEVADVIAYLKSAD